MNAARSAFQGKVSVVLFAFAIVVFVAGMLITTVSAPCSELGAWITVAGLGTAAVACVTLLVRTLMHRSGKAWGLLTAAVFSTGFAVFVAYVWTLLLCRGVLSGRGDR